MKLLSRALTNAFVQILETVKKKPRRFTEVRNESERTDKTVMDVLRSAETYGLVERVPVKKEQEVYAVYSITDKGDRFLREMVSWERDFEAKKKSK
jgi:DNA-binding HxlR family transcriptional regulator